MKDVLGWEAGDVGALTADPLPLDDGAFLAVLRREYPRDKFACLAGADGDAVILLRGRHVYGDGLWCLLVVND